MRQYVTCFLNLPDDSYGSMVNHDRFYTEKSIKDCYKSYAEHVITRRNRYTGLRYNEDPTIMTFELANEPRARSDKSGAKLLGWVSEMSRFVKRLAPRQLVAVGDEGFYGDPNATDTRALIHVAHSVYQPNKVVLGNTGPVEPFAKTLPTVDAPVVFLCTGTACQPPTNDVAKIKEMLKK